MLKASKRTRRIVIALQEEQDWKSEQKESRRWSPFDVKMIDSRPPDRRTKTNRRVNWRGKVRDVTSIAYCHASGRGFHEQPEF